MLVDRHGKMKALFFFFFISFVHLFYGMTNGMISLFNFVSLFMLLLYLMYIKQKMPAHWCIYKFMFYINLIKYFTFQNIKQCLFSS